MEEYSNYPSVYDPNTWPKDKKTPKAWVNEAKQKIPGLNFNYVLISPPGPFLYRLDISFGGFNASVVPPNPSTTIMVAQHNSALEFLVNPPEWLSLILKGDVEALEFRYPVQYALTFKTKESKVSHGSPSPAASPAPSPSPSESSPTPTSTPTSIPTPTSTPTPTPTPSENSKKIFEEEEKKRKKIMSEIVDELDSPIVKFNSNILLPMPDINTNQELMSRNTPSFTVEKFLEELKETPQHFNDVFGDKKLVVKILKEGTTYPETGALVKIHFVGRRVSDGKIYENTFAIEKPFEFRLYSGDALPVFDWSVPLMKLNSEILVMASYQYAYGEVGHPPFFGPKENILIYIKLLEARSYNPTQEESEIFQSTSPEDRLKLARKYKENGNIFFGRRVFKLAYDQYTFASKYIKFKENVFVKLPDPLKAEINQLKRNLIRNYCAYYIEEHIWTEALNFCNQALDFDKNCISSLARRARIYAEMENFTKSKQDYLKAIELDKEKKHSPALNISSARYKAKMADYKVRLREIEINMSKQLMSGDQSFIDEMTKSALEDLENKEY